MPEPANHVFDFTPADLTAWCAARGMPAFRAKQILQWIYEKGVADPDAMSNLSKRDRDLLAHPSDGLTFLSGDTVAHRLASDGVQKLLIQWRAARSTPPPASTTPSLALPVLGAATLATTPAGLALDPARQTECVLIPSSNKFASARAQAGPRDDDADPDLADTGDDEPATGNTTRGTARPGAPAPLYDRRTACISSQIGCPVGCKFCASGLGGLDGNLSAGQIVEQVWRLGRLADPATGRPLGRVTNVVFMGMGEPLANLSNVAAAIRTLNALSPEGLGISARKITISTVGLPAAIEKLAATLDLPVTLALSLHAPFDDLRRELIPWAQYSTIAQLLAACQKWFDKTGREITLEYTLLRNVNDRPQHAAELARLARTLRANVNLIRYNEVAGLPFQRPATDDVRAFQAALRSRNINAHIRASRGRDIAAACGQLRHEAAKA